MGLGHLYRRAVETSRMEGISGLARLTWDRLRHETQELTFRPYTIKKEICGESFDFLIADTCAKAWYDRTHEWPELRWVKQNALTADDFVVDCGAHHGLTTLLFSRVVRNGRVIAFEAHPRNAEITRRNIVLNGCGNCDVMSAALGDRVGDVRISDHSNAALLKDSALKGMSIPMTTLDAQFQTHLPTFMKIDVEGYELAVLRGARRILQARPKLDIELHCSIHEDPERELTNIFDLIGVNGRRAFIQLEVDGPIVPFQSAVHTPSFVSRFEVAHLFCLR
jgi:FkbM family methyltransferase